MTTNRELVTEIARRLLPSEIADRWLQLLRPAAVLVMRHAVTGWPGSWAGNRGCRIL